MITCSKCKALKNNDEFRFDSKSKNGHFCWCKPCEKEYHKLNKEAHYFAVKKWKENNKEKVKLAKKLNNDKNRKQHIIPEYKICSTCSENKSNKLFFKNASNKDGLEYSCKDCKKIYVKKHYNKVARQISARTCHLKRKNRVPEWANLDKIREIYKNRPKGYHIDHIVPLNGKDVCGLHVEYNLQYLPASLNMSKGNKWVN